MAVYSINYDLRKPGSSYNELYQSIKQLGDWAHRLESMWLVSTGLKAQQISDRLRMHLDSNDLLLVLEAGSDYAGWLPQEMWNWIQGHRFASGIR